MKKIIITICLILLIMGCKQEEERRLSILEKDNMEIRGVLPTGEDVSTRTTLDTDGLLTLWEEGDAIGVYGNGSSNVSLTLTTGAGTPFGVFRGAQTGVPVGAYYPYTESAGDNYREMQGTLDSEQEQNENASQIAPYDWKISSSIIGNDQDGYRIHFREIMTMLDISIDVSGTSMVGETLGSVTLVAPDRKLAGDFTIDLGNPSALPVMDEQASDRVRARWDNSPLMETGEIINVKMFMNAAIHTGDSLQIILETEGRISTTTVQSAKTMQAGHRYYITLSLSAMSDHTFIDEKLFTDSRDGKAYKTVTIGEQVWMAENLAYLPSVVGPETESSAEPYYYVFNYDGTDVAAAKATEYYQTYGVLYNWPAAMIVCPEGWHLPSDEEWTQLETYLANNNHNYDGSIGASGEHGVRDKIAISMASNSGWEYSYNPGAVGNTDYPEYKNKSGFSALAGGYRYDFGSFRYYRSASRWWNSTEGNASSAGYRELSYDFSYVDRNDHERHGGFSIRCVKGVNLPKVTTVGVIIYINSTTVEYSGSVTSDGGSPVTARGVCWSTSENPTTSNSKTTDGTGLGTYTSNITGLSPNTSYYVRAYATNSEGTAYGEQKSFRTNDSFTDTRDSQVYKTINIGEQVWMAENLAYLPSVEGPAIGSDKEPYYYVYDYDGTDVDEAKTTENYQTFGVLYNWPAAMTACPEGWHLPSDAEWTTLSDYLGGEEVAGGKMKETGTSHWASPNEGANNESGFTALPGGYNSRDGNFVRIGTRGLFWGSTKYDDDYWDFFWFCSLVDISSSLIKSLDSKDTGLSVRCVKGVILPIITTGVLLNHINPTSVEYSSSSVLSEGGSPVTTRGMCWSTSENPTTSNSKTTDGTGVGDFTSNLSGLSPNTIYYVRAYATNSEGTAYGEQKSFTTLYDKPIPSEFGSFTDPRDGKVYKTVTIGEQVWMAENLAYLRTVVPPGSTSWSEKRNYVYGYDGTDVPAAKATENYQTYGVLYNWPAAMDGAASSSSNPSGVQGICPPGWHLPSDDEWTELATLLANNSFNYDGSIGNTDEEWGVNGKIAKSMATDSGWEYSDIAGAVGNTEYPEYRNKSGFSALPGGHRYNWGFNFICTSGFWWSSSNTALGGYLTEAWCRRMNSDYNWFIRRGNNTNYGFSVRCVQDKNYVNILTVTTDQVHNITTTTASCFGTVAADGGSSVTARGMCWSTSENPTVANSKTTDGTGVGDFTSNLSGLSPNTIYYVRAYATNSEGTDYGEQISFITLNDTPVEYGSYTDPRDSKVYKTVTIGEQVWMAENLAYLPSVVGPETCSNTEPYYYVNDYYGTDIAAAKATENYQTYGVLYNWPAAMAGAASSSSKPSGVQGICPPGWHLPSNDEWIELETFLADNGYNFDGSLGDGGDFGYPKIAKSMATDSGWNYSDNTGAVGNTDYPGYRNKSGFSALPAGNYIEGGGYKQFGNIGVSSEWWSSTENGANVVWIRMMSYIGPTIIADGLGKYSGRSVRCVQD